MSLINDALRRASQTEKNRPNQAPAPMGMEAVPETRSSRLTMYLGVAVVILLLLAGLFFWQWLKMRNSVHTDEARENNVSPPMTLQVTPAPPPVAAPAPKPAPVVPAPVVAAKPAPAAPIVAAKPAPAPVVVAPPPVVAAPVAAPVVAPVAQPVIAATPPPPADWPTDIKVSAIFFSRTNPRVMINGSIYGIGDEIEGTIVKKVMTDKVILGMRGHTKEYSLVGQ